MLVDGPEGTNTCVRARRSTSPCTLRLLKFMLGLDRESRLAVVAEFNHGHMVARAMGCSAPACPKCLVSATRLRPAETRYRRPAAGRGRGPRGGRARLGRGRARRARRRLHSVPGLGRRLSSRDKPGRSRAVPGPVRAYSNASRRTRGAMGAPSGTRRTTGRVGGERVSAAARARLRAGSSRPQVTRERSDTAEALHALPTPHPWRSDRAHARFSPRSSRRSSSR